MFRVFVSGFGIRWLVRGDGRIRSAGATGDGRRADHVDPCRPRRDRAPRPAGDGVGRNRRQGWRGRIAAGNVAATETANVRYVGGAPTGFAVTLGAFDAMTFVTSIKPQPIAAAATEKVS
jgi:hypothetical protein